MVAVAIAARVGKQKLGPISNCLRLSSLNQLSFSRAYAIGAVLAACRARSLESMLRMTMRRS